MVSFKQKTKENIESFPFFDRNELNWENYKSILLNKSYYCSIFI